ncbi:MAG: hypothetical protein KDK91_32055, partial [Gammaproteobacteria bacterium]|nr:hypothetical protein [Gammaproteobacteria bacterium]
SFLGDEDAAFTAINTDGLVTAELEVPVRVHADFVRTRTALGSTASSTRPATLPFTAKAAVLSEGWNSGGTRHTYDQVNGTTPVTLLR